MVRELTEAAEILDLDGMPKPLPTMTPEELRAIREEMALTQEEAAVKYGVAGNTYKRWERGERKIPGTAVILSKYLINDFRSLRKNA